MGTSAGTGASCGIGGPSPAPREGSALMQDPGPAPGPHSTCRANTAGWLHGVRQGSRTVAPAAPNGPHTMLAAVGAGQGPMPMAMAPAVPAPTAASMVQPTDESCMAGQMTLGSRLVRCSSAVAVGSPTAAAGAAPGARVCSARCGAAACSSPSPGEGRTHTGFWDGHQAATAWGHHSGLEGVPTALGTQGPLGPGCAPAGTCLTLPRRTMRHIAPCVRPSTTSPSCGQGWSSCRGISPSKAGSTRGGVLGRRGWQGCPQLRRRPCPHTVQQPGRGTAPGCPTEPGHQLGVCQTLCPAAAGTARRLSGKCCPAQPCREHGGWEACLELLTRPSLQACCQGAL